MVFLRRQHSIDSAQDMSLFKPLGGPSCATVLVCPGDCIRTQGRHYYGGAGNHLVPGEHGGMAPCHTQVEGGAAGIASFSRRNMPRDMSPHPTTPADGASAGRRGAGGRQLREPEWQQAGAYERIFGSSASRTPSPRRIQASMVAARTRDGYRIRCGEVRT